MFVRVGMTTLEQEEGFILKCNCKQTKQVFVYLYSTNCLHVLRKSMTSHDAMSIFAVLSIKWLVGWNTTQIVDIFKAQISVEC